MKVVSVVGARPQFVKLAPVARGAGQAGHEHVIVHTGQHYDAAMSDVFFADLRIPAPDVHLASVPGSHGVQTGAMLAALEPVLADAAPDWVLVYGDTNSTLAGALAAVKLHLPVAHLEAGLRSFNRRMPEEHNRVLTDHAADLLLAPTEVAMGHLADEGLAERVRAGRRRDDRRLPAGARRRVGDRRCRPAGGVDRGGYLVATIHRAENTDDPDRLRAVVDGARPRSRCRCCCWRTRACGPGASEHGIDARHAARWWWPTRCPTRRWSAPSCGSRGRGHRLRRAAEGGVPARSSVHHPAHRDRVARDRWPTAGTRCCRGSAGSTRSPCARRRPLPGESRTGPETRRRGRWRRWHGAWSASDGGGSVARAVRRSDGRPPPAGPPGPARGRRRRRGAVPPVARPAVRRLRGRRRLLRDLGLPHHVPPVSRGRRDRHGRAAPVLGAPDPAAAARRLLVLAASR